VNVMLTRLPDGTVNAEPGDLIEVWKPLEKKWAIYTHNRCQIENINGVDHYVMVTGVNPRYLVVPLTHVRHARGGAGHLRLQVAWLREAVERVIDDTEGFSEARYIDWLVAAIADIDNYEYTEPQP